MRQIKQSGTRPIVFLMISSTDHITGKTLLTPTVTISKDGAAFGAPVGVVAEIANGWYKLTPTSADSGTLGTLILHATGTGADPVDDRYQVVAYDPEDVSALGLTKVGGLPSDPADASDIAASFVSIAASISALPTATANADALLARNAAGGANSAPTVGTLLLAGDMKFSISGSTLTVYAHDGTTPLFTRTLTRATLDAISASA